MILLDLEILTGFITYLQSFSKKDTQTIQCLMSNGEYFIREKLDDGMKNVCYHPQQERQLN